MVKFAGVPDDVDTRDTYFDKTLDDLAEDDPDFKAAMDEYGYQPTTLPAGEASGAYGTS